MPFPASRRVVFRKNPLDQVICQLRFPTILEIGSQQPAAFQKRIRHEYPFYEKDESDNVIQQVLPKEMADLISKLPLSLGQQSGHAAHKFKTAEDTRLITLTTDSIAVSEKKYTRWEQFHPEVLRAQEALEEEYHPAFYTRVGLRYQDVIDQSSLGVQEPWNRLINPVMIGILGSEELQGELTEIRTAALIRVDGVRGGNVRLVHGLAKQRSSGLVVYVIDADFYTETRCGRDDIVGILDTFRTAAGNLFRWAATDRLREILEPVPIA